MLARWLKGAFDVEAYALRDLGLRDSTDQQIFLAARTADVVLVSKDVDFVDLVNRIGPPPRLLWVTCGNVSNERLQSVFISAFPAARVLLEAGEPIVEVADLAS